ncbi:MAG: GTPase HflX [Planctomycetota bacterium]|nr:GTPase HflX [Planctomycetota bacterium]
MKLDAAPRVQRDGEEREKAVLVGLELPDSPPAYRGRLYELELLADTAGADTLEAVVQKRSRRDPKTFIGKGKAAEIGQLMTAVGADLLIVDHDLSPSQARNLEKIVGKRVIDRTELILDIFALRARSQMAKQQVELAQMEYALPRLKRLWTHLSREGGRAGTAGIGARGPGEKQIETDRRLVRKRIRDLRRELDELQAHRVRQTRARRKFFTICLVGYTNAGKSTLMRALTGADVFVQNRLFATLDTTTRAWEVVPGKRVFLSDTVGFIRDLPHHLVSSFLATLEEARFADLLLHVVDAADPEAFEHVEVVEETLFDIGAGGVPRVTVLNQIDRVTDAIHLRMLEERLPDTVQTSAIEGTGLDALREKVYAYVTRHHLDLEIEADPGNGRLLARLREWGDVQEQEFKNGTVHVNVRLPVRHVEAVKREGGKIVAGLPEPEADE